jgi:hypothetical protein
MRGNADSVRCASAKFLERVVNSGRAAFRQTTVARLLRGENDWQMLGEKECTCVLVRTS